VLENWVDRRIFFTTPPKKKSDVRVLVSEPVRKSRWKEALRGRQVGPSSRRSAEEEQFRREGEE